MFAAARLKLTVWYLAIIMAISMLFSFAFYRLATRDIQRVIDRIELEEDIRNFTGLYSAVSRPRDLATLIELRAIKKHLLLNLIYVNASILVLAGGAAYFLASQTLRPIQLMIDDQTRFITNSSHELRTPIATLRAEMESNLLEKKISDAQARTLITSNLEELDRLQQLTNKLLSLTKVHNVTGKEQFEKLSIPSVIYTAQKKIAPIAKKHGISLVINTQQADVYGNAEQLTELFTILLDNAVKYSFPKTSIAINMIIKHKHVHIEVVDQGIGIPNKDLVLIFNRFYRAQTTKHKTDGYGLGLAIAKQTVEAHGGIIYAKNSSGKGATFIVELPLYKKA